MLDLIIVFYNTKHSFDIPNTRISYLWFQKLILMCNINNTLRDPLLLLKEYCTFVSQIFLIKHSTN